MIARRALCGVLLLCLAHEARPQVSCNAGTTDCDWEGPGTTCCNCAAGKYKVGLNTEACTDCPAATYRISTGGSSLSSCTGCGNTFYSPFVGATTASVCNMAPLGTFATVGSSKFTMCPVGTALSTFTTICAACPTGKYQDREGKTVCRNCPRGTYGVSSSSL
jgi:hypothetical protein